MTASELSSPAIKTCTKCRQEKVLTCFSKHNKTKDGYDGWCKQCRSDYHAVYRKKNAERTAKRHAKYRDANREKMAAHGAAYRKANSARMAARRAAYRKTLRGFITSIWRNLNRRTINGSHPRFDDKFARRYLDRKIRLEMSREEFAAKVMQDRKIIEGIWSAGGIPSIHRIDSSVHYSVDNITFIPLVDHNRESAADGATKTRGRPASEASRRGAHISGAIMRERALDKIRANMAAYLVTNATT